MPTTATEDAQIELMIASGSSANAIRAAIPSLSRTNVYLKISKYKRHGTVGRVQLKPTGRPRMLDARTEAFIQALLATKPGMELDEMQAAIARELGVSCSVSTVSRAISRAGLGSQRRPARRRGRWGAVKKAEMEGGEGDAGAGEGEADGEGRRDQDLHQSRAAGDEGPASYPLPAATWEPEGQAAARAAAEMQALDPSLDPELAQSHPRNGNGLEMQFAQHQLARPPSEAHSRGLVDALRSEMAMGGARKQGDGIYQSPYLPVQHAENVEVLRPL